jgi:CheY-like chemotaxis protein
VGAVDGLDALAQLRAGLVPALVLIDLMMPRVSGVELIETIHGDPALQALPLVVLSGDRRARELAAESGADGVLMKPVDLDDLLSMVSRHAGAAAGTALHP